MDFLNVLNAWESLNDESMNEIHIFTIAQVTPNKDIGWQSWRNQKVVFWANGINKPFNLTQRDMTWTTDFVFKKSIRGYLCL